ncbi:hypothetical protein TNCV_1341101 [Trichonephila clavipes]|uniref:Histone-lysine N-methyltransferase SETMAR n=1 Tax=Trichonephila clavipes TaxID=2585209 RepID=A0A8X6RZ22_TRICX|nr:hypothetical protein TNCV_1341101 [Trichonephila clavipes]
MGKLQDSGYELLDHSPSSNDFAPSDFHLFPNLKTFVSGKCLASNEEVERATDKYFQFSRLKLPGKNTDVGET